MAVAVAIILSGLIYYPFFKRADKLAYLEEQNELEAHIEEFEQEEATPQEIA